MIRATRGKTWVGYTYEARGKSKAHRECRERICKGPHYPSLPLSPGPGHFILSPLFACRALVDRRAISPFSFFRMGCLAAGRPFEKEFARLLAAAGNKGKPMFVLPA